MKKTEQPGKAACKPTYVTAMEAAYGAPSQSGFGSAVFFEPEAEEADLEALAKMTYQHFVGDLWEEWGAEVWLSPWREAYRRPEKGKHEIVAELQSVQDSSFHMQVDVVLHVVEDPERAREALVRAYDAPEVEELRAYLIGDGEAMSGLLLAGRRINGEATFLVFLLD